MAAKSPAELEMEIPRPEYPRPDWERADWFNLNGRWSFRFDPENAGVRDSWYANGGIPFDSEITVPFSWASPLSGVGANEKGTGWYRRTLRWKPQSDSRRIFLRFGAVDYSCDVWVNGRHIGSHTGGYGTFELEVSQAWRPDSDNTIVVRAEDNDADFQTRGKQGYGELRGIWQPVWLEARPQTFLRSAAFTTSIDGRVEVKGRIDAGAAGSAVLSFDFADGAVNHALALELQAGENEVAASFTVPEPRLWSPDSPYLYEGAVRLAGDFGTDTVRTYFGIREVGTALFEGRNYRWITLNRKPVYLNGALDQSFHAAGYFTYPTDEEMRDEIYLLKRLGLNFVRIHIKPEEPRKLYWADKLGILVMEDMPCYWGKPDERARTAYEREALEVIERDRNHPSIISWVMFNETWGLKTDGGADGLTGDGTSAGGYLPETQEWVRGIYRWAKRLDPGRIVEDHSPCRGDHVETDLNTWHFYTNGYEQVRNHVADVVAKTYPGSAHNYIGGNTQTDAPLMNSECGNVWGIHGGAGDSDLSWHYRYMMNEFRRHEKLCGFIFTEFKDVINEFNGYYRLNGMDKDFGYDALVPGMTLADLHAPDFIVIDAPPCRTVGAGAKVEVPLYRSSFSDRYHGQTLRLHWELWIDDLGIRRVADGGVVDTAWDGYGVTPLPAVTPVMPLQDAVAVLALRLADEAGRTVTRNFITFDVRRDMTDGAGRTAHGDGGWIQVPVNGFSSHTFIRQWDAIQGAKANGAGSGSYRYEIPLPEPREHGTIQELEIVFEAGAKRVLARNIEGAALKETDITFMFGADAAVEYNPNTYYMTDEERHESRIHVTVEGEAVGSMVLPDDPADSRGVLSWHYQPIHNRLDEAGSYGYLCRIRVPGRLTARLNDTRRLQLEIAAEAGGVALYGRNAGRYPIDLLIRYR